MFILAKLGIASPKKMSAFRKYALIIILIIAAIITPSTDPFNMMVVAVPLLVLYEAGIIVSRLFAKRTIEAPAAAA
jgi:sec-independent protein translocase protein TatC